jgi:hypothetical protein
MKASPSNAPVAQNNDMFHIMAGNPAGLTTEKDFLS